MSYKDRTFCSFYADCTHGSTCPRSLTPEVLEGAQKWGGSFGAPISQFVEKPECWASASIDGNLINALTKAGAVYSEVKPRKKTASDPIKLQSALNKIENMTDSEYSKLYEQARSLPDIVVTP